MALTSKDIYLGSGKLYVAEFNGTIPEDGVFEVEANRLGDIKDGCTFTKESEFYTAEDDLKRVSKTIMTGTSVKLKSGVITWNGETLAKLDPTITSTTAEDGTQTIVGGTLEGAVIKDYVVRFVSADNLLRITIVGNTQNGFELGFQKDKETSIDAEFLGKPFTDGNSTRLFKMELKQAK